MFGSHLSISGGMHKALLEAERLEMNTVQVFTKNQQQWKVKPLAEDAITAWLSELNRLGWNPSKNQRGRVVSHASYLINLASPNDDLWAKSIDLMTIELERCEQLEIQYLVHHPGAYTTSSAPAGITRIAEAYEELFKRTAGFRTLLCLEDTVGSGSNLGRTFEELAEIRTQIIAKTSEPERVGFCLDTCHLHAGGYDLSSVESGQRTLELCDQILGLELVYVLHLNDSLKDLGSRKDRHAHIGEGTLSREDGVESGQSKPLAETGFAAFMRCSAFQHVPKILETPKEDTPEGTPMDTVNLNRLRALTTG